MYLSRLIIKNYRSIEKIDIKLQKGKNIILGRNNAGKSNIIKAIDIALGENSPTYNKSENITDSDFYSWKEKSASGIETIKVADEIIIVCILTREDSEDLDFEQINKCTGYYKLLENKVWNPTFQAVEKRFDINLFSDAELESVFQYDINCEDSRDPTYIDKKRRTHYVDSKLVNQISFTDEFKDKRQFGIVFRAKKREDNITKDIRFLYRETEDRGWLLGFTAPVRNELLQSAIITSFRDPQNQLRLTSYTWYGKLMKNLTADHNYVDDLKKAQSKVKDVADKIFEKAKDSVQSSSLNVAFPGAEIFFQFNEDFRTEIYKDTKIFVDDGFKSPLSEKGSGIQSATIIGLFNLYVTKYNTKTSALLCVEEPELYLHPHARRVISDRFDEFLQGNKNQVVITTHSSEFIKTTKDNLNIVLVRNTEGKTTAETINIRQNKSLLLDNNYNEIFFADKVIVCEGNDEYVLKWVADYKFPERLNGENISIINGGGKDTFIKFVKLILKLKIQCYIFADFDFFLRDDKQEADKYKIEDKDKNGKVINIRSFRHRSVADLPNKYFEQQCIFGNSAPVKIGEINKLRSNLKKTHEALFYTAKTAEELPNKKQLIPILSFLRKSGVGILNGELEDLSKDPTFLSPINKLDLTKVFEISSKLLNENKKIDEIIEIDQIKEFLVGVFNG